MSTPISSIFDLEARARERLPAVIFDYVHGGAGMELTLQRNQDDLCALALRQHDMRDVSHRQMSVKMVGEPATIPLAIGPTGLAGLTWANGEVEAAKAAEQYGVPFCLSTMSICSIEDVAEATSRPFWFQLYLMKEHKVNESLVRRAHHAGCSALVLTLDLHVQGKRWADAKNGLSVPPRLTLHNTWDILSHPRWLVGMAKSKRRTFGNLQGELEQSKNLSALTEWIESQFDPSFDIDTVKWVRQIWDRKLILKGIMHVDDARLAVDIGADAIIVSNHGGRQLDGVLSTARAMPAIADAVKGDITLLADSGIRSGLDVVRMIALGADTVLLGRAFVYALAAAGEAGVANLLDLIDKEMRVAMTLTGAKTIAEINAGSLVRNA